MKYRAEIIDSLDAWKRLSVEWNNLLDRSASKTVFLTWEWLFSWAECYLNENRKLFIICVYRDIELVGIAPWYVNRTKYKFLNMKQIEFLGSPEAGSDYLDVITKRGKEKEVAAFLYQFLFDRGRSFWDCMMLREVPSSSLFLLHFLAKIEADGKYFEVRPGSYCPVVSLPSSSEAFLSTLSSNRREQFRRHWRMLSNQPSIEYRSFFACDGDAAFNEWCSLYRDKNQYYSESLDKFINILYLNPNIRDCLQIDLVTVEGKNIAGLFQLLYKNEMSMFLMTVDKEYSSKISIGNVIVGLSIQVAINHKCSHYDFLKGNEEYKFHWSDNGRRSLNIFFPRKKLGTFIYTVEQFVKYSAKIILR